MKGFFLFFFLNVYSMSPAFAGQSVGWGSQFTKQDSQYNLFFSYDQEPTAEEDALLWSTTVSLNTSRARLYGEDSRAEQTNRDLSWINLFETTTGWVFGAGLAFGSSKINNVQSRGLRIIGGRTHVLNSTQSFYWELEVGGKSILQKEANTATEELKLVQSHIGGQMNYRWRAVEVGVFFQNYYYNKDVDQELLLLTTPEALTRFGSAFSNTLSTLLKNQIGLDFSWDFHPLWQWSIVALRTQDVPRPEVVGRTLSTKISYSPTQHWTFSADVGHSSYDSIPQAEYNYFGIGLIYGW
jgi:hypothetical protein